MTTHEQVAQDLPLYALGTLAEDDRRSVEEHLSQCRRCRYELHVLRQDMARLSLSPLETESDGHDSHAPLPPMINFDPPQPARKPRLYWLTAIPIGIALVLGAMLVQLRNENAKVWDSITSTQGELSAERARNDSARLLGTVLRDPATYRFTVHTAPDSVAQLQVMYSSALRHAVVVGSHLPRLAAGTAYHLWLVTAAGDSVIHAGSFTTDQDGNATLLSSELPERLQVSGFQITAENPQRTNEPGILPVFAGK